MTAEFCMRGFETGRRGFLVAAGLTGLSCLLPTSSNATIQGMVAVGKDDWLFPVWDEVGHVDLKSVDIVADIFTSAFDVIAKANIQVAVLLTPAKSRIYRDKLPDEFRFSADGERRYDVARAALSKTGTLVPDIAALLSRMHAAQPEQDLFFRGDTHWTAAAAEASAVVMAKAIIEKFHLRKSTIAGVPLDVIGRSKQDKNDLAALLSGPERLKYKLETFPIHAVTDKNVAEMLEPEGADVVVVGNSYMQPRFGFSNMLSNQLARPVSLFWKVHQIGPYATLLQYLASTNFKEHKPTLLVWNIHETDITLAPDRKDGWSLNAMPNVEFISRLHTALGV